MAKRRSRESIPNTHHTTDAVFGIDVCLVVRVLEVTENVLKIRLECTCNDYPASPELSRKKIFFLIFLLSARQPWSLSAFGVDART